MKQCCVCKIIINKKNGVKNKTKSLGLDNTCKECNKKRVKKWVELNKEKVIEYHKKYAKEKSKEAVERVREWRKKNKERRNKNDKEKYRNSIQRKMEMCIRNRINKVIKRRKLSSKKLLGCSLEEFINYIENKFSIGMTWNNFGKWHIDHIKPLSRFNLEKKEEQLLACNYKNLQPLWAEDNLKKSNKYEEHL